MRFIYLDTETTGLDPDLHSVWEVAYAEEDEPIRSSVLPHNMLNADPEALTLNAYDDRGRYALTDAYAREEAETFEGDLYEALDGATVVGANPAFDTAFLRSRWYGKAPWHHRLLDVEAYAMAALGHASPCGLHTIATELRARGYMIPLPDHTAAGDVNTVRQVHRTLARIYKAGGLA